MTPMEPGHAHIPQRKAALRLPALPPLHRPAGLARRWVAYVLDLALSLIFTFGWAAGVILFVFLVNTLLDLNLWGLMRYGRNAALTIGLFLMLFAIPYAGYYILPLHRTGRTAGFVFLHLRMIRREEGPSVETGRGRTFGRIGIHRAFLAALPALLAGIVALSLLPDATDRPTTPALLNALRLPTTLICAFLLLTQILDRLRSQAVTLGVHERLARVQVVREPRLRELMERERRVTEAHIAGGMAHEIRNALGTARLQLDHAAERERAGRARESLEDILKSLTRSSENTPDLEGLKRAVAGVRRIHEDAKRQGRALEEVSAAVDRGLAITSRVMDYSKLQPSIPKPGESPATEPRRLVAELVESYREALEREGIRIRMDLGATRAIPADAGDCYSVFQNLLLNARDAIREKRKQAGTAAPDGAGPSGTIRISSGDADRVWIRIEDDGVGIPPEHLERIFDPFYSTKPSLGMGLGLNECRRIVDLYGGEIQVESEAGAGTRFNVLWPAVESSRENGRRKTPGTDA